MNTYDMAIEELTDAVVWKRAAVLAPSQAEQILKALRRGDADDRIAVTSSTCGQMVRTGTGSTVCRRPHGHSGVCSSQAIP